jgi:hypothetical protein
MAFSNKVHTGKREYPGSENNYFVATKISTHQNQRSHSTIQRYHSARKTIVTITHPTFSPQAFRSDIVVSGGWRSLRRRRSMTLFFLFSLPGEVLYVVHKPYMYQSSFKKRKPNYGPAAGGRWCVLSASSAAALHSENMKKSIHRHSKRLMIMSHGFARIPTGQVDPRTEKQLGDALCVGQNAPEQHDQSNIQSPVVLSTH